MTNTKLSYLLLALLFVLAPLYSYPNLGGVGLSIPFNITVWLTAIIFIGLVALASLRSSEFSYSTLLFYCSLFLLIIIVSSSVTDVALPDFWLFRLLTIVAGFLFIAALFQLRFTAIDVERVLYLIVIAMAIHTLVGVLQVIDISEFTRKLPMSGQGNSPFGIFQQPNLLATYLVTGVMIILFLISRPSFISKQKAVKVFMVVTFGIAVYIILATGSRIGLLSLLISLPVMIVSRKKQLFRPKKIMLYLMVVSSVAVIANSTSLVEEQNFGLNRTLDKVNNLSQADYKTYREGMYRISLDLIKQKPLLGHGFTSFPRVWTEQKARFIAQNPNAAVSPVGTGHPHNELLLWLIEGGVIAGLGLLIVFLAICRALCLCGFSRGGSYLALLLPISLHTQTAWPFYGSALHWFLWLFIIYMVFRHQTKMVPFNLNQFIRYFVQLIITLVVVVGIYFLWHTHKAHDQLRNYMRGEQADMQLVLDNTYFHRFAEKVLMQSVLYSSIEEKNSVRIPNFIRWAEGRLAVNAEPGMFIMLTDAYGFVDDTRNQCRIVKRGLQVYPQNVRLQQTADKCQ